MKYLGRKTANLLFSIIVVVSIGAIHHNIKQTSEQQIQLSEQKILQEAIAHFDNMVITRSWNAMYEGVYVKQQSGLQPNPYLQNNILKDEFGNTLIKINPAWMTRQISELSNAKSSYYYKITSLKPLNPSNTPDNFEIKALNFFEKNRQEKYYFRFNEDRTQFNFMGALVTEASCLSCHIEQGYKEGDIRGGIRVSVPSDILQAEIQSIHKHAFQSRVVSLIFGGLILIFFYRFTYTLYLHQQKIETLNNSLEKKINERTLKLEKMYRHERYIKELLKTVSGVNELLLSSLSIHSAIKASAEELAKHKHYCFTWVGLIKDDLLEIAHKSSNNPNIIQQNVYSLSENMSEQQILAALKAIKDKKTIVEAFSYQQNLNNQEEASSIYWLVAIPLISNDNLEPFGVFNIYSDREEGFEDEEIRVLERLSTDIGLILYSHKQKAILEKMEFERVSNYEETILAFVNIIEQRDTYTAGHTLRVAEYCKKIATALNIEQQEITKLEKAAILHDIGKVATPDAVLLKPGRLNALEYELIKQHAFAGYNMLSKIDMYKDLAEIIRYHHVRYDGNGYPKTHSPAEVPFLSHIMAVADAFDAMTTNRIYKPRQTVEKALEEINHFAGTQFHPKVAKAAIETLKDIQIKTTSQSPSSELEQKRFSYFFCDALTELYNESYLQIMLSNTERKQSHLYLILLSNFSQYNKREGWEQGSQLLLQLAKLISENFSQALAFRYHGDDFILLSEEPLDDIDTYFKQLNLLHENQIQVSVKYLILEATDYEIKTIYNKLSL